MTALMSASLKVVRIAAVHCASTKRSAIRLRMGDIFFLVLRSVVEAGFVELITLPLFGLFFNLTVGAYLAPLLIVFALGSTCIASVGTLFAAMAGHSRLREFFLPLLSLPILIPALISCVEATSLILAAGVPGHTTLWPDGLGTHLAMLAASGVICFFLALLLFDFVMEE